MNIINDLFSLMSAGFNRRVPSYNIDTIGIHLCLFRYQVPIVPYKYTILTKYLV